MKKISFINSFRFSINISTLFYYKKKPNKIAMQIELYLFWKVPVLNI